MAELTVVEIALSDLDGLDLTTLANSAASGGDSYVGDADTVLFISSTASGTPTVTLTAQVTATQVSPLGAATFTNKAVTLAAGNTTKQYHMIAANSAAYNDSGGKVQITYSAETSLLVLPVRIKRP